MSTCDPEPRSALLYVGSDVAKVILYTLHIMLWMNVLLNERYIRKLHGCVTVELEVIKAVNHAHTQCECDRLE